MALADYDTAAEKIAAFKCATMDPALAYVATSNFTANDVIYVVCGYKCISAGCGMFPWERYGFNLRINNGDSVTDLGGTSAIIYIKDGDITYSDPITLYQKRLALVLETNETYIYNGSSFTAGTYGSLMVYARDILLQTGEKLDEDYGEASGVIPVPSGQQVKTQSGAYSSIRYFDVPSNW